MSIDLIILDTNVTMPAQVMKAVKEAETMGTDQFHQLLYNGWPCNCGCYGHKFVILSWKRCYFDTVVMIKWWKMIRMM